MDMEREEALAAFVTKQGRMMTIIGVALCFSDIFSLGVVVLLAMQVKPVSPPNPAHDDLMAFLGQLVGFLLIAAFLGIPLMMFIMKKIIRRDRTVGDDFSGDAEKWAKATGEQYLKNALILASIAEAPGVFAFVTVMIQLFNGQGLFHPEWVTGAAIVMGIWAMILKITVVPTATRLEARLKMESDGYRKDYRAEAPG